MGLVFWQAMVVQSLLAQSDLAFPASLEWRPRFQGIDSAELTLTQPRPLRGFMARVDLKNSNLHFVVTPDNGDRPEETDGLKTSSFLKRTACDLAINANPFSPVRSEEDLPQNVRGLLVNEAKVVSEADESLPAVLFHRDRRVTLSQPPFHLEDVQHAISGFSIVLEKGHLVAQPSPLHPRTAAGISPDNRFLYLLVIDGRQPGYSEGATTAEVGAWLRFLGASEGINLDGGGTSTMVFRRKDGSAEVVNRPIHAGQPGQERVSGAHFGVKAPPLN